MSTKEQFPNEPLEYISRNETFYGAEQKLRPLNPELLDEFKDQASFVTQVHLSHPDEPYSIRVHEHVTSDGAISYSATLKGYSDIHGTKGDYLNITTEITPETFAFYSSQALPRLQKLEHALTDGVRICWYPTDTSKVEALIEAEHPSHLANLFHTDAIHPQQFENVSDTPLFDDAFRTHVAHIKQTGKEALPAPTQTSAEELAATIVAHQQAGNPHTIVTIAGRSGSGKSTAITELKEEFAKLKLTTPVLTLSTDNYHRGNTWLTEYNDGMPWQNWDEAIVYDTAAVRADLLTLLKGGPIHDRVYRFEKDPNPIVSKEPIITPAPIIILEGLYAGSPIFRDIAHITHEITTPLATAMGRRIARDLKERVSDLEAFTNAASMFRYAIETAEPTYQTLISVPSTHS